MKPCAECGQRLRDPRYRHRCPHGRNCIGPSIHSKKTVHRSKGVEYKDRKLYCPGCCLSYYSESPTAPIAEVPLNT